MAVKASAGTIVCAAAMLHATVASAQSIAVEFDQSAGYSTEDVMAAHMRLHAFGEAAGGFIVGKGPITDAQFFLGDGQRAVGVRH